MVIFDIAMSLCLPEAICLGTHRILWATSGHGFHFANTFQFPVWVATSFVYPSWFSWRKRHGQYMVVSVTSMGIQWESTGNSMGLQLSFHYFIFWMMINMSKIGCVKMEHRIRWFSGSHDPMSSWWKYWPASLWDGLPDQNSWAENGQKFMQPSAAAKERWEYNATRTCHRLKTQDDLKNALGAGLLFFQEKEVVSMQFIGMLNSCVTRSISQLQEPKYLYTLW